MELAFKGLVRRKVKIPGISLLFFTKDIPNVLGHWRLTLAPSILYHCHWPPLHSPTCNYLWLYYGAPNMRWKFIHAVIWKQVRRARIYHFPEGEELILGFTSSSQWSTWSQLKTAQTWSFFESQTRSTAIGTLSSFKKFCRLSSRNAPQKGQGQPSKSGVYLRKLWHTLPLCRAEAQILPHVNRQSILTNLMELESFTWATASY